VVRTAALSTIMTVAEECGFEVKKFIQDYTLIEDAESSIDLICQWWKLFHYPQRLAFSATPPDFGSLLIQRRRWANGGLLVLPKLWRYVRSTAVTRGVIAEVFMSAPYLLSLGPVSLAFLVCDRGVRCGPSALDQLDGGDRDGILYFLLARSPLRLSPAWKLSPRACGRLVVCDRGVLGIPRRIPGSHDFMAQIGTTQHRTYRLCHYRYRAVVWSSRQPRLCWRQCSGSCIVAPPRTNRLDQ